jgi:hypothetical protein
MVVATADFAAWLEEAAIAQQRLTPQQQDVLQAAFSFRQQQGSDYFSMRLLSHFLLHCDTGLKVAQVARLVGISRPTASGQQALSSKQVIQQAHHRLRGRPYGKLLPRFAGAIAAFLLEHKDATRAQLLDFIDRTFAVRVSRIALYKFLKKYGLDHISSPQQAPAADNRAHDTQAVKASSPLAPASAALACPTEPPTTPVVVQAAATQQPQVSGTIAPASTGLSAAILLPGPPLLPGPILLPAPPPAPPFSSHARSMPAPSC